MLRVALAVLIVVAGDEPKPEMVPDASWVARPGDRVVAHRLDAMSGAAQPNFDSLMKFSDAGDQVGMKSLVDRKIAAPIEPGTPVLVLSVTGLPTYRGSTSSSTLAYRQEIQDAVFRSATEPKRHVCVEVRVMDGPQKDQIRFVAMEFLARLIPKPVVATAKAKPKATPKPVDPASRAAILLQAAKNLERSGNVKAATEDYKRIVVDFPDTPSAKTAAIELKRLSK
jgi:hypothetical protein